MIVCGRYASISAVRGDTLSPPLLGMIQMVSVDMVRCAMNPIQERSGMSLLASNLVAPVLSQP